MRKLIIRLRAAGSRIGQPTWTLCRPAAPVRVASQPASLASPRAETGLKHFEHRRVTPTLTAHLARRRRAAIAVAAAAAALLAGASPAAAQAADARAAFTGAWGKAIEVPGIAALNTGGNAAVQSVSCTSAGNCSAGGYYTPADGSPPAQVFVASEVHGIWGAAEEIPGMPALNKGGQAQVNAVSCASAGNCSAVGFYKDSSGHGQAFVVNQVNGTWDKAREVLGSGALDPGESFLSAVSCASPGNCSAGGTWNQGPAGGFAQQAFVISEVHGAWGKAREVPGTGAPNTGENATVQSVSCTSAGNCSAGGWYTQSNGNQQAFVVTQTHGAWGKAEEVPGTAALNQTGYAQVNSVSCASAGNCSAGGEYNDSSDRGQAFVVTQTHGAWGKAEEVPGTGVLNQGGGGGVNGAFVTSVSCAAAGTCSAGGNYKDSSGHFQAFVASQVHGIWGKAAEVPGTAALNTAGGGLTAVSCSSAASCAAGGNYTDTSGHGQVFVADQVNGIWGKAKEVPGTAALNVGGFAEMLAVSCAPAGTCAAGGFYAAGGTGLQAFVVSKA
jgi:hypothetical protein